LVPGKDGLVHISSIARDKQQTLTRTYKNGDVLKVKVIAVEAETGRVRLIAPELK
jgi:ribosomal protein S1